MAKYVCKVCGYVHEGDSAPEACPVCKVGPEMFEEVKGELKLAAEHEYGVYAKTVKDNDGISAEDKAYILEQLKANFYGECSEVGPVPPVPETLPVFQAPASMLSLT